MIAVTLPLFRKTSYYGKLSLPEKMMPNTSALHLCYHHLYFSICARQIYILNHNTFGRVAVSFCRGASGGCQVDPRSTTFLRKTLVITTTVLSREKTQIADAFLSTAVRFRPTRKRVWVSANSLPNITLLTLIATLQLQGESPTSIFNEDAQHAIKRAIGVSHTACKHDFRQNIRSHRWSVFSFLLYISVAPVILWLPSNYSGVGSRVPFPPWGCLSLLQKCKKWINCRERLAEWEGTLVDDWAKCSILLA